MQAFIIYMNTGARNRDIWKYTSTDHCNANAEFLPNINKSAVRKWTETLINELKVYLIDKLSTWKQTPLLYNLVNEMKIYLIDEVSK